MMGCLFGCFRASGDGGEVKGGGDGDGGGGVQLVPPSLAPATSHKVGPVHLRPLAEPAFGGAPPTFAAVDAGVDLCGMGIAAGVA
jgi:hypothetical protein